ncbi:MAG: CpaF family protein [Candidatus Omnitrophica bacterium]|nr:CpaF family protein [Candidatus Omnitrophota bacterium]MCF7891990.1 CpaF family protein [Candidatus Omnitrophota bacterium]MCF7895931.1 CpaF family protein [Candidatus Omnitrophota bacterium]MCF7897485.1 CpaF family protein [Candidatus Omnitrophota bacterium]MCF7909266.1 CpaF family protein [Candidatus Omnitrophota bacterium]
MNQKEIKESLRKDISSLVGAKQNVDKEYITERAVVFFERLEKVKKITVEDSVRDKVVKSLCDDFLGSGPIQRLMDDPEITEIMVNGPKRVYIEKGGSKVLSGVQFDDKAHLRYIVEKMVAPSGRRVDESSPYVDFSLKDGSRVNVILPPLAVDGITVTIRKFLRSIAKVEDLVKLGTVTQAMADFLVACIKAKVNIMFSGATGSGKTTTLEVLSSYIDHSERIITIEDALELNLRQDHVIRLLTRLPNIEGRGSVPPRELFRNSLRMRPNRIILGEIRGKEAMDYLQALNSGHRGSLSVIHASDPIDALTRLETMSLYAGLNLPAWAIRKQISQGLDLIVQQGQLQDGTRKLTHITEVGRLKDNNIELRDIFTYEIEKLTDDFKVKGSFQAKNKPTFFDIFKKKGIKINEDIFT